MGLISFFMAMKARDETAYLEERVITLEYRVRSLEDEMRTLKTKKG